MISSQSVQRGRPTHRIPPLGVLDEVGLLTMTVLLVGTVLLAGSIAEAQEATATPREQGAAAASELYQRCLEALGGAASVRKSLDAHLVANVRTLAQAPGLEVRTRLTLYTRADGARRLEQEIQGQRQVISTNGKESWQTDQDGNVADLDPRALATLELDRLQQQLLTEYARLNYDLTSIPGPEPTLAFRRQISEAPGSDKAPGSSESPRSRESPGDELRFVLDARTHLPVRIELLASDPWSQKPVRIAIELSDYRPVNGVQLAHRAVLSRNGKAVQEVTIESARLGERPADDLFRRPAPRG